jgi:hypothetical protein
MERDVGFRVGGEAHEKAAFAQLVFDIKQGVPDTGRIVQRFDHGDLPSDVNGRVKAARLLPAG